MLGDERDAWVLLRILRRDGRGLWHDAGKALAKIGGQRELDAFGQWLIEQKPGDPLFQSVRKYRDQLESVGLIVSGASPDNHLAEIMEFRDHPFFVGVQFHPELRSRPNRPHPLFLDFIKASVVTLPEGAQRTLPLDHAPAAALAAVGE